MATMASTVLVSFVITRWHEHAQIVQLTMAMAWQSFLNQAILFRVALL